MKTLLFILLLYLSGCSILGDRRVAAGCQLADGVTTYHALEKGAVEVNPFLSNASPGAILLIKGLFAAFIYWAFPEKPSEGQQFALGLVSIFGCAPAINNLQVIRRLDR